MPAPPFDTRTPSGRGGGATGWLGVVVGALIVLLLAEAVARQLAGDLPEPQRWSTPETQYKVEQMQARGPTRVAVVGSSVVDAGLDPAGLGPDAYNASLGAGSLAMVDAFTRAVVVPDLDPDVVIVGVSSRELNGNARGQDELTDAFFDAPALRERAGTESVLDVLERRLAARSALVRHRGALRDPGSWSGPDERWNEQLTGPDGLYLGFLEASYRATPQVLQRTRGDALHRFEVGRSELTTLRRLLGDLVAAGREVVVVVPPVSGDYLAAYPQPADHERFVGAVRGVAEAAGAPLVVAGVWEDELMADPLHTNRAGTERFTALVRDHLAP